MPSLLQGTGMQRRADATDVSALVSRPVPPAAPDSVGVVTHERFSQMTVLAASEVGFSVRALFQHRQSSGLFVTV